MNVVLHLYPRHYAAGVADLFATGRVTAGDHGGLNLGQFAEGDRLEALKKTGRHHLEHSQIRLVGDVFNFGQPWAWILKTTQDNLLGPADDVGVCHDAVAIDDKAGPAGGCDRVVTPRGVPDRGLAVHQNLNHGSAQFRRLAKRGQRCEKQGGD